MEWLPTTYALILGILLRLALPVLATVVIAFLLKRLDERWKKDVDGANQIARPGNLGCWDINNCPEENRAACKAYQNPDTPCWQVFRTDDGRLQERCIGCDVFRHAPVPITA